MDLTDSNRVWAPRDPKGTVRKFFEVGSSRQPYRNMFSDAVRVTRVALRSSTCEGGSRSTESCFSERARTGVRTPMV